eukprot:g8621.t1
MDGDGKMWVFGGDSGDDNGFRNDVCYLDTEAIPPSWTCPVVTSGESPSGRYGHSAVLDPEGKMWIFGGRSSSSSSRLLNDVCFLRTQASPPTWICPSTDGDGPDARLLHTAVMDTSQRMWVFGGQSSDGSYLDDVYYLDTQASPPIWMNQTLSNPLDLSGHTAVMDSNTKMWVFGGSSSNSSYLDDVYYLDLEATTLTWSSADPDAQDPSPVGRLLHAAVMHPNGSMWIVGGQDGSSLDDVCYFNTQTRPRTWTCPTTRGFGPSGRYGHSAVFDPNATKIWIFGGQIHTSSYLDDVYYLDFEATTTTSTTSQ